MPTPAVTRFSFALVLALQGYAAFGAPAADTRFSLPSTDANIPGKGPVRRYDWFQNLWIQRRTLFAQQNATEQGSILFLGDSITQGWGDVGSLFPGIKVANRGISGDTTRGVLLRLQEDVIAAKPKAVVLLIGTNDLEEFATLEDVAGNLKLILEQLRAYNAEMPVILCRVFPSSASKTRPAARIRALNDLYAEVASSQPQVTILDTWSLFADVQGDAKLAEFPDLLHPNGLGYAKWARALTPILETLELVPTWPDSFAPEADFRPLFNGKDLTGWMSADGKSLDGATLSPENRYKAVAGRLVATTSRKGQSFTRIETGEHFPKDFILKLEFRASPNADSGIYIRGEQVQCRDYALAGPWNNLRNYRPSDWNEVIVTVKGQLAHATCNGETLVDAMPIPEDGTIGIESDRGQVEYRRIRIKVSE